MNRTLLIIAGALVVPATAALAQAVPAGTGALAGRSPQISYRTAEARTPACGKVMHSLPAGKLPVHGTHAHARANCASAELARADMLPRSERN